MNRIEEPPDAQTHRAISEKTSQQDAPAAGSQRGGLRGVMQQFSLPPDFNEKPIYHPLVSSVLASVSMEMSQQSRIVMVAGPTGAGKTFLRGLLYSMIMADLRDRLEADRSWIPVIFFDAPATYEKNFMWTSWYMEALQKLNTSMPMKQYMRTEGTSGLENRRMTSSLNEVQLERMFIQQVEARGCSCMIVDEAQHLLDDSKSVGRNLGILKSLTNRTNMTFVLIGTYRQATFLSQLQELVRRTRTIDFPRYDVVNRPGDAGAFGTLLLKLAEYSAFPGATEVVRSNPRLLFKGSLGLIGMLKPWFIQACNAARLENRSVTVDDFRRTMVHAHRLEDLLKEIKEGEKLFRSSKEQEDELEARLGISDLPEGESFFDSIGSAKPTVSLTEQMEEPSSEPPKPPASKPFQSLTYRRPLGNGVVGGER